MALFHVHIWLRIGVIAYISGPHGSRVPWCSSQGYLIFELQVDSRLRTSDERIIGLNIRVMNVNLERMRLFLLGTMSMPRLFWDDGRNPVCCLIVELIWFWCVLSMIGKIHVYSLTVFFSTRQYGQRGVPHPGQLTTDTFIPDVGHVQHAHMKTVRFFFGAL